MDTNVLGRFNCAVSLGANPEWLSVEYAQKKEVEEIARKVAWQKYRAKISQLGGYCLNFTQYTLQSLSNILWGSRKPANSVRWYFLAPLSLINLLSSRQRRKGNFGG